MHPGNVQVCTRARRRSPGARRLRYKYYLADVSFDVKLSRKVQLPVRKVNIFKVKLSTTCVLALESLLLDTGSEWVFKSTCQLFGIM